MAKSKNYESSASSTSVTSCSSESSSESCSTSESSCPEKVCKDQCPVLSAREIACKYADAVVSIQSEFILLGGFEGSAGVTGLTSVPAGVTGTVPFGVDGFVGLTGGTPLGTFQHYNPVTFELLSTQSRYDAIVGGNGFFIKDHFIVAPAQLVLMPPSYTSGVNRWPLMDPSNTSLGYIKNEMVRATRILVTVNNVNGKGHSFVYEADLVGVDGAGDIAVLRINYKKQWNYCNPCIEKCHPTLSLGQSRKCRKGDRVYLLGDFTGNFSSELTPNIEPTVVEGTVGDYRYLDHSGWLLPESVLVSAGVYGPAIGMPILNGQGKVIAMQTTSLSTLYQNSNQLQTDGTGQSMVAGPSEYFMRQVLKAFFNGTITGNFIRNDDDQVETICDPAGAYYRYVKAYLGVSYEVMTAADYDVTRDYSMGPTSIPGLVGSTRPGARVRVGPHGELLNTPSCKEIVGVRVSGLAGANPDDLPNLQGAGAYVPGGDASPNSFLLDNLPVSPLLGKLHPGDVIVQINDVPLGDLGKQVAPSLITWRLCPRDQIEITYRRGGFTSTTGDNAFTDNYDNLVSITTCLSKYPPGLDYPWYAAYTFPVLFTTPYPGFLFPANQVTAFPQSGPSGFRPSI